MRRATLILALILSIPVVATAAPIGIDLTATITTIDDHAGLLGGVLHVGNTITAKYVYDSVTPDSGSGLYAEYWYNSAPYGFVVRANGLVFRTDPANVALLVGIEDNYPQVGDGYLISSYNNHLVSSGLAINQMSWQLDDLTGAALDRAALPTIPPLLSSWGSNVLTVAKLLEPDGDDQEFLFQATVTSATLSADPYDSLLPEPTTASLLSLGLASLFLRRRAKV